MTTPQASSDSTNSSCSTKTEKVVIKGRVQEMEQRCRRGTGPEPPDAVVTGLEVFPCNDDPGTGFERRPSV